MLITILMFMFASHIFRQVWSQTLKFGAGIHYYMLITILMFVFSIFLSLMQYWASFLPKPNVPIHWNLACVYIINIIC